ncbi:MAG: hypothetical protein ACYS0H_18130 [Planctomycetota bacterium]|jgi:hypothetical protein
MDKNEQKNKSLLQFKDIVPLDVGGEPDPLPNLHKMIADLMYKNAQTLDMLDIAMQINRGEPVSLSPAHATEILSILENPGDGVTIYARIRVAVKQFLKQKGLKEA